MEEDKFSLKNILFNSIQKKLLFGFIAILLLMALMIFLTFNLNQKISQETAQIRNVEAPLELMVEEVIGYDAMLTGNAHEALLHAENNETEIVLEHQKKYDEIGIKLDNLLKFEARSLLANSTRDITTKNKVNEILNKLDKINLDLVDLEVKAFDAMKRGDTKTAKSLIVTSQYVAYKKELNDLYIQWSEIEYKETNNQRQQIIDNSRSVILINVFLGILTLLLGIIIAIFISISITKPIKQLKQAAEEVEQGNFKARVNIKSNDELNELGYTFNKTITSLERMDEEKKQVDKAKTEFISITSHELRSPMTPMKAQLQMLLEGYYGKLTGKQTEAIDIIVRNTDRLDKIIVDFLEISRIEAARLKFNFIKTSLNTYIIKLKEEMNNFMPEKKINLELKLDKLPVIEVDPDRVLQILRNLINNAIKFSKENSKIILTAETKKEHILFSVKDTGIGIAKENQARIFEPFFQEEQTIYRNYSGTGLGLAICKGIVESQKGKIWFESEKNKGTTFYFTLPFEPTKEIEPIRLLFSSNGNNTNKIKELFIKHLGPLGEKEFEDNKENLTKENIFKYIDSITKQNIINKEINLNFKKDISEIFDKKIVAKESKKEISEKEISKFIKEGSNGNI